MPKDTFYNLSSAKRNQIISAFLREFALKSYDEASVSEVVKRIGISKGSVYQYFENKLDLFLYLLENCTTTKQHYISSIKRADYKDFWHYYKDLFYHGYQFDEENPMQSHFLHNLHENLNSPSIHHLYRQMVDQSILAFENMVRHEVALELFKTDTDYKSMGFLLYKFGVNIQEFIGLSGIINIKESIQNKTPVYQGKRIEAMQIVEDFIQLVRPTFDKIDIK